MNSNRICFFDQFSLFSRLRMMDHGFLLVFLFLISVFLISPGILLAQQKNTYRQPAYINNAYFSDKISQQGDSVQPLSVVKALPFRANGVLGYFILDLILTQIGAHHIKVDILNQNGDKSTELLYPPVQVNKQDVLPMYTAAGTIAGNLKAGLWFFKVYDQVNKGKWNVLGTFSVVVTEPGKK